MTALDAEGRALLQHAEGLTASTERWLEAYPQRRAREVEADLRRQAETLDPAAMTRYVRHLAQQVGARVVWSSASPYAQGRRVIVPALKDELGLIAALHEIGHVAHPCRTSHPVAYEDNCLRCLRCELAAWEWAQERWTFSRAAHREMKRCLGTYMHHVSVARAAGVDGVLAARRVVGTVNHRQQQLARTLRERP